MASYDHLRCRCGRGVAFVKDLRINEGNTLVGIFTHMFNVEVAPEHETCQALEGKTLLDTFCVNCRAWLGWKVNAVSQGSRYEKGQFVMMMGKLTYANGQILDPNVDQDGGDNNANNQDGGANNADNQNGGANNADNQDGGANNQDGGSDEENVDQDGGDNNANNQDGVANNADNQDGGANNQDGGANNADN
ncbi:uncharacterized protein DDB_G0290685-like [Solanum pennellii]|uniref:Uncharacterized protein DDB_G0290685-like n=1 Tax=Solanum pennellii TaxID=28526 RepID=A0ABM1H0A8_SOLPN|nr:uncharacterized protein DDB_G0290685-like [Solanum pennellii]